jgi:carbon storage regulator
MLVLTRKPGEAIIIGNNIKITVVDIGHGRVKIGVEAPANVSIDREEVFERKQIETAALPAPTVVEAPSLHNRIASKLPPATPVVGMTRASNDPRKPR